MPGLTVDELEERMNRELGTIRNGQLEEIGRAAARETSAGTFRKEMRRRVTSLEAGQAETNERLATIEGDVGELKTDVAQLKTDVADLKTDVAEIKGSLAEVLALLRGSRSSD